MNKTVPVFKNFHSLVGYKYLKIIIPPHGKCKKLVGLCKGFYGITSKGISNKSEGSGRSECQKRFPEGNNTSLRGTTATNQIKGEGRLSRREHSTGKGLVVGNCTGSGGRLQSAWGTSGQV